MIERNSSTPLRTAHIRPCKYDHRNARRIANAMNDDATPYKIRRAIREAIHRIAAHTDIDPRDALRPETLAVLLRVAVVTQASETWRKSNRASRALWDAFNTQDRVLRPRVWARFDEARLAYTRKLSRSRRDRARRAARPVTHRRATAAVSLAA